MIDLEAGYIDTTKEPLRWAMHGGPGTGKTHVTKTIKEELFGNVLKWNASVEYQIVALQAVMADLLQGDTIHHAFNIPFLVTDFQLPLHNMEVTEIYRTRTPSCSIVG